jgi:class 3 adenylate cyclase
MRSRPGSESEYRTLNGIEIEGIDDLVTMANGVARADVSAQLGQPRPRPCAGVMVQGIDDLAQLQTQRSPLSGRLRLYIDAHARSRIAPAPDSEPAENVTVRTPIRYAQSGDTSIAYQITGAGPFDLVLVPGFISHLEMDWEEPRHAEFLERLGSFARLIRLDKRGTGLSDRQGGIADLEARMDDVRAVMDAAGSERAALFGYFEGGPMSILFAASYPERTRALVLFGTHATALRHADYPFGLTIDQLDAAIANVVEGWGQGRTILRFAPEADSAMQDWWGARERAGGSPGAIRQLVASSTITDVRNVLPSVQAPTIVLVRTRDPLVDPGEARYLAERIAGARLVEVPGASTLPWLDAGPLLDEVQEFLTGARPVAVGERVLKTILFTDLVGSTEKVRAIGDAAWARLVERHHSAVRRELQRFAGEEIDTAGDGFFAMFDGPSRAIRCALAIENAVSVLGLEVRAGVHTGEVERPAGARPRGIAVHVAARVAALAGSGEVIVTATTRDLVAGSGLALDDRGEFDLKGLDERRRVYVVADRISPRQA